MGLYYQTEYRLGRRGGRVCRNYTGFRAFLAIAIDLFFVLTFDLILGLLFFALIMVLKLLKAVAFILSLPFRLVHWISLKLQRRAAAADAWHDSSVPLKPAWTSFDEV